tara:strand:+ start:1229 stop:1960 length:732 start_codon:yes stop_codon:yes gene_type:complete
MRHVVLIKSKNPEKFNYCKFGTYKDRKGKIVKLVDPNGIDISGYEMHQAVLSLNINDEDDKRIYEFLKNHPLISKFSIDDMRATEEKSAETALKSAEAITVASKLNFNEIRDVALLMGLSLDLDDMLVKAKVIQYANSSPENFLTLLNDIDKEHRIFLKKALNKGVLNKVNGVLKHGSNNIGLTDDQAIVWLKDNADMYALLKHQLRTGKETVLEEAKEEVKEEQVTKSNPSSAMQELMDDKQ